MKCQYKKIAGKAGDDGECPYEYPKCRTQLEYPCPYEDEYYDLAMESQDIMKEQEKYD